MSLPRIYHLHFVGIGGIGMSGIAEIFLQMGHKVSGSDLSQNEVTERLVKLGATIYQGHERRHVGTAEVVVISSAVRADNPEVMEANRLGVPVIPRAEMLAEIMRGKTGVAVAGTHGKTTTTSMTAQILLHAGLDPTVVVGGKVEAIGSNAKMGGSALTVVEADESDGSFNLLPATHAIITNIDRDHMEHYKTDANLFEAFLKFTKKIPFYGRTWLCLDDVGVKRLLPELTRPHSTYGFDSNADLFAKNLQVNRDAQVQTFEVWYRETKAGPHSWLGTIEMRVLGRHNVYNALAAIGMSLTLGASFKACALALREFKHVKRRFDEKYHSKETGVRIVDDYGHHPTEIKAVLETASQTGHKRVLTVFQPHRYTRTELCWNEFLTCFSGCDELVLLPIYSAGEDAIPGVDHLTLADAIKKTGTRTKVHVAASLKDAARLVLGLHKPNDLILTLGAGSITALGDMIKAEIQNGTNSAS